MSIYISILLPNDSTSLCTSVIGGLALRLALVAASGPDRRKNPRNLGSLGIRKDIPPVPRCKCCHLELEQLKMIVNGPGQYCLAISSSSGNKSNCSSSSKSDKSTANGLLVGRCFISNIRSTLALLNAHVAIPYIVSVGIAPTLPEASCFAATGSYRGVIDVISLAIVHHILNLDNPDLRWVNFVIPKIEI